MLYTIYTYIYTYIHIYTVHTIPLYCVYASHLSETKKREIGTSVALTSRHPNYLPRHCSKATHVVTWFASVLNASKIIHASKNKHIGRGCLSRSRLPLGLPPKSDFPATPWRQPRGCPQLDTRPSSLLCRRSAQDLPAQGIRARLVRLVLSRSLLNFASAPRFLLQWGAKHGTRPPG